MAFSAVLGDEQRTVIIWIIVVVDVCVVLVAFRFQETTTKHMGHNSLCHTILADNMIFYYPPRRVCDWTAECTLRYSVK